MKESIPCNDPAKLEILRPMGIIRKYSLSDLPVSREERYFIQGAKKI